MAAGVELLTRNSFPFRNFLWIDHKWTMNWSDLPAELIVYLINALDHEEVKSVRLLSRWHAEVATPVLFRTVHLSPNTASFERAKNVSRSERLRLYVRCVIFHVGILGEIYPGFDDFKNELPRTRKLEHLEDPTKLTGEVLWYYNCWLEEVKYQTDFDYLNQALEVETVCKPLENLESITTILDEYDDPFADPQDYIGRRTGMPCLEQDRGSHFSDLCGAVCERKLTTVIGGALSWDAFSKIREVLLGEEIPWLESVKHLELELFNSEFLGIGDRYREYEVPHLRRFLNSTPNLQVLKLDFDELPYKAESVTLTMVCDAFMSCHWPSLRRMELFGVVSKAQRLLNFLDSHSVSLKKLSLGDIELFEGSNRDENPPSCFFRFFRDLAQQLSLDQVHLEGVFTNRVDQSWYVDPDYQEADDIRTKLEHYLAGKISWPFSTALLASEPKQPTRRADMENFADTSWEWYPELLEVYDSDGD